MTRHILGFHILRYQRKFLQVVNHLPGNVLHLFCRIALFEGLPQVLFLLLYGINLWRKATRQSRKEHIQLDGFNKVLHLLHKVGRFLLRVLDGAVQLLHLQSDMLLVFRPLLGLVVSLLHRDEVLGNDFLTRLVLLKVLFQFLLVLT